MMAAMIDFGITQRLDLSSIQTVKTSWLPQLALVALAAVALPVHARSHAQTL